MEKAPLPPSDSATNPDYRAGLPQDPAQQGTAPDQPPPPQYQANQYGMYQHGMYQHGMNQPVVLVVQAGLTDVPAQIECPHCKSQIVTETRYVNGVLTWLLFGSLFLFFCWPCSCIPFCTDSSKDVEHSCPNCRLVVHRYKRL